MTYFERMHAAGFAQMLGVMGKPVVHWPAGVEAAAETITAIIDRSEQISEFAQLETQAARTVPLEATLTMATTVNVTYAERPNRVSVFVIDGERWYADRQLAVEADMQQVRVIRDVPIYTKPGRMS